MAQGCQSYSLPPSGCPSAWARDRSAARRRRPSLRASRRLPRILAHRGRLWVPCCRSPGGPAPAPRPRPEGKELRATLEGKAVAMSRLVQRVAQRDGPASNALDHRCCAEGARPAGGAAQWPLGCVLEISSPTATAALVWRVRRNAGAYGSPGAGASGIITLPSTDFGHTQRLLLEQVPWFPGATLPKIRASLD